MQGGKRVNAGRKSMSLKEKKVGFKVYLTPELQEEINLIKHCIAEIQSKKKVHNKQLRKYIAYLKIAEKRINTND